MLGDRLVHWHVDDLSARFEKLLATGATEQSPRRRVDAPLVQALADVATIGLLQERAIRGREILTEQLQGR